MDKHLTPIAEEDYKLDVQDLNAQLFTLKEELSKKDEAIRAIQARFTGEIERSRKLMELIKFEEIRNNESEATIFDLKRRLHACEALRKELTETADAESQQGNESEESAGVSKDGNEPISDEKEAREDSREEIEKWVMRCKEMENMLEEERVRSEMERSEHAKVADMLAQCEELLKAFKDDAFFTDNDVDDSDDEKTVKHKKATAALKASVDVQSRRNMELHEEIQRLRTECEGQVKLLGELQCKSEQEQKAIKELNFQNEREYRKNEKLKSDSQRLKRDLESWKKIHSDMKVQYHDLRVLYDGVCKTAEEQKRETVGMKLLMERDKRSLSRQRDEIDKYKGRTTSLRQTYDDLKVKFDQNAKQLVEKTNESQILAAQVLNNKKIITDLQSSNKDLKKRSDFSQKELMEKHKNLMKAEERLKVLQDVLDENEREAEECKRITKAAIEKAEEKSQEAITKEKGLLDRVARIQNLEAQVQIMTEAVNTSKEDGARLRTLLEENEKVIREKDFEISSLENDQRDHVKAKLALETKVDELKQLLETTKMDLLEKQRHVTKSENSILAFGNELAEMDSHLRKEKVRNGELRAELNEMTKLLDVFEKAAGEEDNEKTDLKTQFQTLLRMVDARDDEIRELRAEMEEDKRKLHAQKNLLKEMELKLEDEDVRLAGIEEQVKTRSADAIYLKRTLSERDAEIEEMRTEFSKGVRLYLQEVEELNDELVLAKSENERLRREKVELEVDRSEHLLELEEDELQRQMENELKREIYTSKSIISDLKEDVRVLTQNLDNDRDSFRVERKEMELKIRRLKSEKDSLLEHVEELQAILKEEKDGRDKEKQVLHEFQKEVKENERKRVQEMEVVKAQEASLGAFNDSVFLSDCEENFDQLRREVHYKATQLSELESKFDESSQAHRDAQHEMLQLLQEKEEYVNSIKRENTELKRTLEEERQWMDENTVDSAKEGTSGELEHSKSDQVEDETRILAAQKVVIQKIKSDLENELQLDRIYEQGIEDERKYVPGEKTDAKTAIQKVALIVLLSPLAFFFSCDSSLTFVAVFFPLFYFIYKRPWNEGNGHEKEMQDAVNKLTTRLASECAETEHLRRTVDNMRERESLGWSNNTDVDVAGGTPGIFYSSQERSSMAEKETKQLPPKQSAQSQDERKRTQRQNSLFEKLEIKNQKDIKNSLGQYWGYEELKMALTRLRHEREVENSKGEAKENELQRRLARVIAEALETERRKSFTGLVFTVIASAAVVFMLSLRTLSLYAVASAVIIAACSLVYGIKSRREIETMKSKLKAETSTVESQEVEIEELTTLFNREYDVVTTQKQAIEALEQRLNEEFKKNKEQQLIVAKLALLFQEGNDLQDVTNELGKSTKGSLAGITELAKLVEGHAHSKVAEISSMKWELQDHVPLKEEQQKAIGDLNTTKTVVESRFSMKTHREQGITFLDRRYLVCAGVVLASLTLCAYDHYVASFVPLIAMIAFMKISKKHDMPNPNRLYDMSSGILDGAVCGAEVFSVVIPLGVLYHFSTDVPFPALFTSLVIAVTTRVLLFFFTRQKNVRFHADDIQSKIREMTQLITLQTEEIQTLNKLLEVERSYSQYTRKVLMDKEGAHREDLATYELNELRIILSDEKLVNVELRKSLAEKTEEKDSLDKEIVNLKRKLEMQKLKVAEEHEEMKYRIEELMEDMEGERRAKQELSAQLIEERSLRELKQIEVEDLKEKLRDDQQIIANLREQVLNSLNGNDEINRLRQRLNSLQNELEDERFTTQSRNRGLRESMHKLRENNLILQRTIEDSREREKERSNDDSLFLIREQSEVQQEEIEEIQILLEDITNTVKAQKYQDVIDELQTLRRKLEFHESNQGKENGAKLIDLLAELEHEKEKTKVLDEAVEELHKQQQQQRKMYESEKMRAIELARQISGEDLPMLVEEEKDELDDKRGVLYWLATNGGLTEWKNPAENGLVEITRSSYGHGKATDVADRKPSWCSTSNKHNQWWKIDFGEKRTVVPTAYSLRHGWSGNAGALRHWVLEGSLDGRRWTVLRQHNDDNTINFAYASGYWNLPDVRTEYRLMRVRQTGPNSTGTNALRLCGFEVYGKIAIADA